MSDFVFAVVTLACVVVIWWCAAKWDENHRENMIDMSRKENERRKLDRDLAVTRALYEKKGLK